MDGEYLPIGNVLPGVEILPLGEGCVSMEAIVLIRAIDREGNAGWYTRYTNGLSAVESLGALHAAILLEEDAVRRVYEPLDGDD